MRGQPEPDSDYTVGEVQRRINASRQTVYDLIRDGSLESYKVKSSRRITAESLERLRSKRD